MQKNTVACPIWGPEYEATIVEGKNRPDEGESVESGKSIKVDSERAGGRFEITDDGQDSLKSLGDHGKARLTSWLVEQRNRGIEFPRVTESVAEYASNRRSLWAHERAERLLRFIATQADVVGVHLRFDKNSAIAALAWIESTDWREVDYFFDYLKQVGWLDGDGFMNGGFIANVTVDGYSQIAELYTKVDATQAFVAMWFDESMKAPYKNGIRPAIEEAGYVASRIDEKEHVNKIDDEIIAEIRRSRFLVADFTQGNDGARGGVYYEAGFAHALGLPVIFTCNECSLNDLHFDTEHYNHIVWTDEEELREKLKYRILAVLGEGPNLQTIPGR